MSISGFFYTIKQGFKNIFRNSMFSLASIATMIACILLFGAFFSVIFNVNSMVRTIEDEVGITVLFDEGISQEEIDAIGEKIGARDEVKSIEYTSPEEAWETDRNGTDVLTRKVAFAAAETEAEEESEPEDTQSSGEEAESHDE